MAEKNKKEISIVPYLNDIKVNCKFCNSKFREEAEAEYERSNNYMRVFNFLKEQGEELSYPAVRNHLAFHYQGQANKDTLKEYSSDVNQWLDLQGNPEDALRRRIAILERRMILLDSGSEILNLNEKRKNTELVKKLCDSILAHEARLEESNQQFEPFREIIHTLTKIVNVEAKAIENPETKQELVKILNKIIMDLRNEFKDML